MRIPENVLRVNEFDCFEMISDEETITQGPVVACYTAGSSSETNSVDYVYNAGMLDIAEDQQAMAQEYYDYWKNGANGGASFRDVESAQNTANLELMPYQTDLQKSMLQADQGLLGVETEAQRAAAELGIAGAETGIARANALKGLVPAAGDLSNEYFTQALGRAKDPTQEMDRAQAGVMQAFGKADQGLQRYMSLNNIDSSSGKGLAAKKNLLFDRAKGVAGARTNAYNQTFTGLQNAANTALGVLN